MIDLKKQPLELVEKELNFHREMEGIKHCMGSREIVYIKNEYGVPAYACLVMERVSGDLKEEKNLSQKDKVNALLGSAKGIDEMHKKDIIHRDIKGDNILYDRKKKVAKLGDFGLAKYEKKEVTLKGKVEVAGTPKYMSPETKERFKFLQKQHVVSCLQSRDMVRLEELYRKEIKSPIPSTPADIYSFGIVMHEMFADPKHISSKEYNKDVCTKMLFNPDKKHYQIGRAHV